MINRHLRLRLPRLLLLPLHVAYNQPKEVGPNNGRYITGTDGTVTVSGLTPDASIVVSESKALTGYILDETPKNIVVRTGAANSLTVDNKPGTTLIIRKFIEGTENEPLSGVAFKVVDGNGGAVGPDDGVYYTDRSGEGYVLDTNPKSIKIKVGEVQTITVYNTKAGDLTIIKKDEETGERISGVQFEIRKLNGEINGAYTTDRTGVISLPQVENGWYQVTELKAAKGYRLDSQSYQIEVKDGQTATLEITNRQAGSALIHKVDSLTGEGIYGVTFARFVP